MAPPDRLEALERQLGSLDMTAEVTPIRVKDALWLARIARRARAHLDSLSTFRRASSIDEADVVAVHRTEDDLWMALKEG